MTTKTNKWKAGDVLQLTKKCDLGEEGERARVDHVDEKNLCLVFSERVVGQTVYTGADYRYLKLAIDVTLDEPKKWRERRLACALREMGGAIGFLKSAGEYLGDGERPIYNQIDDLIGQARLVVLSLESEMKK